jgi:signal transduction histidine kinase
MLKPIFDLTQATSKINQGNFDVTVRQRGIDELSTLTQSFNSMTASIRELIKNHDDLTRKIEAANEELKKKDQLKNEFINVAAHELCAPIQPILGQAELLRRRKTGSAIGGSKQEIEKLDTFQGIGVNTIKSANMHYHIYKYYSFNKIVWIHSSHFTFCI